MTFVGSRRVVRPVHGPVLGAAGADVRRLRRCRRRPAGARRRLRPWRADGRAGRAGSAPTRVSAVDPSESFVAAIARPLPGASASSAQLPSCSRSPTASSTWRSRSSSSISWPIRSRAARAGARDAAGRRRRGLRLGSRRRRRRRSARSGRRRASSIRASTTSRISPALARDIWSSCSRAAGLRDVEGALLTLSLEHPSFDDWWEPLTLGVGPAGRLHGGARQRARAAAARPLPRAACGRTPLIVTAQAWAARGRA